jgi:hypothetical protein
LGIVIVIFGTVSPRTSRASHVDHWNGELGSGHLRSGRSRFQNHRILFLMQIMPTYLHPIRPL